MAEDAEDREIVEAFAEEAAELLRAAESALNAMLNASPEARAPLWNALLRGLHTVKGSAGFLGEGPLARKIEQFESRGRVVTYDDEAWPESAWIHAFLARGIIPRRWDPLADRLGAERTRDMLTRMKAMLEQTAGAMPRV